MSKLDELIAGLCPDGVKYASIGECCNFKRGTSITKSNITPGDIPVIAGGKKPAYYHNEANRTGETITVSGSGAYAGFVMYWNEPVFVSDAFTVEPNEGLLVKYTYYFLTSKQDVIHSSKKGVGVPHVYPSDIAQLRIPIPPLPVQKEIVRILDNFSELVSELTSELSSELASRKKQYEHYRDLLLTFGDEVPRYPLDEILTIRNGKDYKTYNPGDVPVYGSGGIIAYIDTFAYDKPSVLIPRKGSIDKLYYVDKPFWTVDTIFYTEIDTGIAVPKYVFYSLQKEHLEQYNTAGGVPSLTQAVLNKVKIPVPSIEEQEHIITILDSLEALYNDLAGSLSAEIEARKKQYDYYRDKLLSFKEVTS